MLQDKIYQYLIKINKLTFQNEEIRYIIPLYFNTIKYIHDNCTHLKIDPILIEQVNYKFKAFHQQRQLELHALDQVHTYMIEECLEMLESKHVQAKSELKRSNAFTTYARYEQSVIKEELITLPQEIYNLDEYFQKHSRDNTSTTEPIILGKKIIRPISMDEVPNFRRTQTQVCLLWETIQKYYQQHRLDQAYALCQNFQNSLFLYDPNSKLTEEKESLIKQIHEEYNMMTHQYQFFSQPGYLFDKQEDGVSMFYKIYEETKEVAVRVEAELDISIEKFLCIVSEVDLFEKLVPFSYDSRQLKQITRNKKVGATKVYVPLLSNRQAFFYATAHDRLKTHNSIFFYSKTISSDLEFQKKLGIPVKIDQDLVELSYKFYIMEYSPIGVNRGKIRLAANIDMQLGFLPLFVINKSLRIFSFDYFRNLMEVSQHYSGSEWEKRMQQKPYIYIFFKQRIRQYIQSQYNH